MTENQIIEETLRYLSDTSYNYAILIDGEWGCGKTYFVQNTLKDKIVENEGTAVFQRKFKYISLYGCKSIQDIQENIVWGMLEDAKEKLDSKDGIGKLTKKIGANHLISSKKLGELLLKQIAPETNIYEMLSDWISVKEYIFVFDDIERCDCPLNEVFGYINGLVEHEKAKVILIANEKEICVRKSMSSKEMQYSVVLNDRIEWPSKEERQAYGGNNNSNSKINIEILEERRKILFSDEEIDDEYRKIREKLIGVTLCYQPNIRFIAKSIIEKANIDSSLKETLIEHMEGFISNMDRNQHHNLRTFQFFLSKVEYLYTKFNEIELEEEYKPKALSFLVRDCFNWAVRFKGSIMVPTDKYLKILYEAQKKSEAVKIYVETGEYRESAFKEDIRKYVEEELKSKLLADDPFNLLYNQYYFHTQQWCEDRIEDIKIKLKEDKYPLYVYTKIIELLVTLTDIGFSEEYLMDVKTLMLDNISKGTMPIQLSTDLFAIEDIERKGKIRNIINEINSVITIKDSENKQKTINEILSGERWIYELERYTESDFYKLSSDTAIFSKSSSRKWLQAIMSSSVEELYMFRQWLYTNYCYNIKRERMKADIPIMMQVINRITPEKEKDLIKRRNLLWLKEQLGNIIEKNQNM